QIPPTHGTQGRSLASRHGLARGRCVGRSGTMAKNKPEAYGALRPWQRARAWVDRVTTRKAGWVSWVLAVALVLCGVAGAGLARHCYDLAGREAFGIARDTALFGDAFGAFAALASALATIGMVAALLLQQKQLTLQREELALQRAEMR